MFISIHFCQSVNLPCADCKDSHPRKLKSAVKCPQGHSNDKGSLHSPVHWLILSGIEPAASELQIEPADILLLIKES